MEESPRVVPVTDIRRDITRLIEEVNRSCRPVFISQRGYLTAVLLSCDRYEALRRELNASQRAQRSVRMRRDEPASRMEFGPYDIETAQLFAFEGYATELDEGWMPDD